MFKKSRRDTDDTKVTQMNLLDGKNAKSKMKNTLRGINSRLVLSEENLVNLKTATETTKNET